MNSLTEKISVKDFNNFFENDQTSKGKILSNYWISSKRFSYDFSYLFIHSAFSRLAERKLKKFHRPKYYKYNKVKK